MSADQPGADARSVAIVVMGVSGSGKSTIAGRLADRLGWTATEADDLHSPANIAKMAAGTPLTDADRAPWLRLVGRRIDATAGHQVLTCSALRRRYRDLLRTARSRVVFLHLDGSPATLGARLSQRRDHFMPPSLLRSQLAALEPLDVDEDGVRVDVSGTPSEIVERALVALGAVGVPVGSSPHVR